jgi:hypothetical protein
MSSPHRFFTALRVRTTLFAALFALPFLMGHGGGCGSDEIGRAHV